MVHRRGGGGDGFDGSVPKQNCWGGHGQRLMRAGGVEQFTAQGPVPAFDLARRGGFHLQGLVRRRGGGLRPIVIALPATC